MHEFSLVGTLLKQADEVRRAHGASVVREIRVEIGPLSGVEPLLLHSAFEQRRLVECSTIEHEGEGVFAETRLVIELVPLTAMCRDCDATFEIANFEFLCPTCHGHINVTGGDELILASLTVADDSVASHFEEKPLESVIVEEIPS